MLRYPLLPPTPILSFSLYPLSPLLSTFLSLLLFFPPRFIPLFTYLSVNLSSCASPVRFLSSSFCWPKFSIPSFSFSLFLFLFSNQTPGLYAIWKASGLKRDITSPSLRLGHGNTEYGGPILSAKKFIARSTLIGREIIGHSFSPFARSKRLSLIHDFSRIIAGSRHLPLPPFPPLLSSLCQNFFLLLLSGLLASKHHSERLRHVRYIDV